MTRILPILQPANPAEYIILRKSLTKFQNKVKHRHSILKQQLLPWLRNSPSIMPKSDFTELFSGHGQGKSLPNMVSKPALELVLKAILLSFRTTDYAAPSNFNEWVPKPKNGCSLKEDYRNLLMATLKYAIDKLNQKAIYSNMISFCAKVLALCFFKIPGLASALLQVLSVRPSTLKRLRVEMGTLDK
ncbi:hypothetical protein EC973_002576 [Apophysomyces ossiformis]|uniref:Uncharacterized protein n=1 Tax=Apophysomyces ossiformis TaxID=679940 RepID=A0A8H7BKI5_9FUNG|nr:hypothetical protein EC973_002576 [Apophysomyces ossiformis]